jgi:hypothetical protein
MRRVFESVERFRKHCTRMQEKRFIESSKAFKKEARIFQ